MASREYIRNSYEAWYEKQDAKGNLAASYTEWLEELSTEYTKLTIKLSGMAVKEADAAMQYQRQSLATKSERAYLRGLLVDEKEAHARTLNVLSGGNR